MSFSQGSLMGPRKTPQQILLSGTLWLHYQARWNAWQDQPLLTASPMASGQACQGWSCVVSQAGRP